MKKFAFVLCCCYQAFSLPVAVADDPFAVGVRTTPHLSPAAEQDSFTLPPGFEIQLFASEPDIFKPLNMAFDERGRLWLTNTVEYPYAAPDDRPGRDSIRILEDTDGDGRADKFTTFADRLNIPMGLYPYQDGVVVFSIPNIWHLRDTNNDGKADVQTKLYGPFGTDRDTHGLNNAFRRNFDGWVYACHGFNNYTQVQGADGNVVEMHSGNTYRFRLDGSRIEHFTHGQVNPFGMAFDSRGDIFTADCHSKPITQLLRGGYYPSFGRPHNGLGFLPPMMDHLHGSTAISGIVVCQGDHFPALLRNTILSGNVMTSCINHNRRVPSGSTYRAHEQPNFLTSTDPWFRPVDLQLGPDGAIYIADFYNRIIGHYEVPLTHPGRDRTSGRIWRITYTGKQDSQDETDLTRLANNNLIQLLNSSNQTLRFLAMNRLVDHGGKNRIKDIAQFFHGSQNPDGRSCALWVLHRLDGLSIEDLDLAANDLSPIVRTHAMKILAEAHRWQAEHFQLACDHLEDTDPFVRRAAIDALMSHPQPEQIALLLAMSPPNDPKDNHLHYSIRLALLNHLQADGGLTYLDQLELNENEQASIAEVLLASPTASAASYLLKYITGNSITDVSLPTYLQHIARHLTSSETEALVALAREKVGDDLELQSELLMSIVQGRKQHGVTPGASVNTWAENLVSHLLQEIHPKSSTWSSHPYQGKQEASPWGLRKVASTDGQHSKLFIDSRPGGEPTTGVLRSATFIIPPRLSFYLAGHRGYPQDQPHQLNQVRLLDVKTDETLAVAFPPASDIASKIEWDVTKFAGKQGYLEIVDGDTAGAFAWLAFGRLTPQVVDLPKIDPALVSKRIQAIATLTTELKLQRLRQPIGSLLLADHGFSSKYRKLANALASLTTHSEVSGLTPLLYALDPATNVCRQVAQAIVDGDRHVAATLIRDVVKLVPSNIQQDVAKQLIQDRNGVACMLSLIDAGSLSPRILQHPVIEQALQQLLTKNQLQQVATLTAELPPQLAEVKTAIISRAKEFPLAQHSPEIGQKIFEKQCAICHRIGDQGALIGPQLDGIGNRGLQRLLEDILDPNRNVDAAFRTSTLVLESGKVVTGLFRRQEGAVLVFAGNDGKEFMIADTEIDDRVESPISLMPTGMATTISIDEFHDLLAYLLTVRGPTTKPVE
ncbi:MAG: PVC-type heme-binding CxxCH protein [Pirellulales bacterium]